MKNFLIIGALPNNQDDLNKYEVVAKYFKNFGNILASPVDTKNDNLGEIERFNKAVESVKDSDFIIGDFSKPSTGQGFEIGIAFDLKIPLLVLAKKMK